MSLQIRWIAEGKVCEVIPPPVINKEMLQDYDARLLALLEAAAAPVILANVLQYLGLGRSQRAAAS
jgi:hypothetical protein